MEYFYRDMRKQYDILMTGDQPVGGQWNFDKDNRSPPKKALDIPGPYKVDTDKVTLECMQMVSDYFPDHFGDILPFFFATTREGALAVLDHFINNRLANFGTYQDAMLENEPWMYHSHISFYLNCGLLLPLECIEAAEEALHQDKAPLNAVEGFIRQILGWREFIRGIYWLKMPAYETENFLKASKPLPNFFWSSDTPMNCMKQVILETKENAYAHHIQRLMVIGNFALLAGLEPKAVNEWFWIVYADAYQWVELPNVSGMALFADGGVLGSKPYAASGAYINKMSNYCQNCQYNIKEKTGEQACPFNYLYWDFLERNRQILSSNPRLGFMYRLLDNMSDDNKQLFTQSAAHFLNAQY
jgi:deoxyribodipyrimidine photolyase-related protein